MHEALVIDRHQPQSTRSHFRAKQRVINIMPNTQATAPKKAVSDAKPVTPPKTATRVNEPETVTKSKTVARDIKADSTCVRRLEFTIPQSGLPPLPAETSQRANGEWIKKVNVPEGLIKQRGDGRTADIVRKEMECVKLGADAMEKNQRLLVAPEATREAQAAYVQEHLPDSPERTKALPLTGQGRTLDAVAADLGLVIAVFHVLDAQGLASAASAATSCQ